MRKTTVAVAGALFLAAALSLTGCPNSATVQPEGGKTPSNTGETKTEKVEAVSTSGTMGKPEAKADGSTTLTTTDSTGGWYTFTQPAAAAASIRSSSSSSGGTWDYTNRRGIKQFAGSYSGDITSSGAGSLSLTVEKAADPSGKLQEVTAPQNFEFKVTDTGTFTATIPAVEIKVQQQPAATAKLIKRVTATESDPSFNMSNTQTIDFYSNKTFKHYISGQFDIGGLTWAQDGVAMTGIYTGNPLVDGQIVLNVEKIHSDLIAGQFGTDKATEAYIQGEKFILVTATEADLLPHTWTSVISISGNTFTHTQDTPHDYTQNPDGSTTFSVNVFGDDITSVGLSYTVGQLRDNGGWSNTIGMPTKGNFSQRIPITDATEKTGVSLTVFLDKDEDGSYNSSTDISSSAISIVPMKLGHHVEVNLDIRKLSISFDVQGDASQYQNIHITSGSNEVSLSEGTIDVLLASLQNSGSLQHLELNAVEMPSGAGSSVVISDTTEYYLWKETPPAHVTFTLYNKLQEGRKITIETYPADATFTDEEKKHFRFKRGADDNIIFYIPTGTGSDGEFITKECCANSSPCSGDKVASTHFSTLLEIIHIHPFGLFKEQNYNAQLDKLYENMGNLVRILENRKGLTVYGKELIGL